MKTKGILFVMALLVVCAITSEAQVLRRSVDIWSYKRTTNAVADSSVGVGLEWNGMFPDSVQVSWYAKQAGDSVKVALAFKAAFSAGTYSSVIVDSIKAAGTSHKTITASYWTDTDLIGLRITPYTGNATVTPGARVYLRWLLFYHK
jgi:hypothetical protein